MYQEIEGDLIKFALKGKFDVIAHGCNCFCTMGAGIAVKMREVFFCNSNIYHFENHNFKGDVGKLGNIQYVDWIVVENENNITCKFNYDTTSFTNFEEGNYYYNLGYRNPRILTVVNAYTQYNYGLNHLDGISKPLDYEALTLCMRKINHIFKGKHIGLPQIGCGLAGGDWNYVKQIIQKELCDCDITIVIFKK